MNFPYSTIRAGATSTQRNGSVHRINTYKLHDSFELSNANIPLNDIGLIKIADYFNFDSTRQPIRIINPYDPTVHESYNVTGWDINYNNNDNNDTDVSAGLKKQQWLQIDNSKCSEYYFFWNTIKDNIVCAVSEGDIGNTCAIGDLGDPLIIDGYLLGVKSWKMNCDLYSHSPTLFTNVLYYYDWITLQVGYIMNLLQAASEDYTTDIYE